MPLAAILKNATVDTHDAVLGVDRKVNLPPAVSTAVAAKAPDAVKLALDLAIMAGGPAFEAAVRSNSEVVRRFLSDRAISFLASVVEDLHTVNPK